MSALDPTFSDILKHKVQVEKKATSLQKLFFYMGIAIGLGYKVEYSANAPLITYFTFLSLLCFFWVTSRAHLGVEVLILFSLCFFLKEGSTGWAENLLALHHSLFFALRNKKFHFFIFSGLFLATIFIIAPLPSIGFKFSIEGFFWVIAVFCIFFESPWSLSRSWTNSNSLGLFFILFSIWFFKEHLLLADKKSVFEILGGFNFAILALTFVYAIRLKEVVLLHLCSINFLVSLWGGNGLFLSLPLFFYVVQEEVPLLFKRETLKKWYQEHTGKFLFIVFCLLLLLSTIAVGQSTIPRKGTNTMQPRKTNTSLPYHFEHSAEQVKKICLTKLEQLKKNIDLIGAVSPTNVSKATSLLELERILTEFSNETTTVTFLKYVSTNETVRSAADHCEMEISKFFVDIFVREDLFKALKGLEQRDKTLSADEKHLLEEYLSKFRRNGLELPFEARQAFIEKKKQLVEFESQFSTNLNEYKDDLWVTEKDLEGLPASFKAGLKQNEKGEYLLTLSYPHYFPVMENAKSEALRKRYEFKFNRRGGEANKALFDKAIALRRELASMLNFKNHSAFVLDRRMAKNPDRVFEFLKPLTEKLKLKRLQNLTELTELKRADIGDPKAEIRSWDWKYYDNQLKKSKYDLDAEKLKDYFPLETVTHGMFEIYQTLLGVSFEKDITLPKWHDSVLPYKVLKNGKVISFFYMDLFPREGKYNHAAAFTLVSGYMQPDGFYRAPVSSIVANFTAPQTGKPSLLQHSEVETLFHEFGHIMHQILTTAPFGSFSGTAVKYDFVEAPSQMFQNWVWDEKMLGKMSGHYETKEKLPSDWVKKLIGAKQVNQGIKYCRQASFALMDLEYHTAPEIKDSTEVYARNTEDIMGISIQEGTLPQAGFGHLMGGYDSGYYGYLWSEVFAWDMFDRFKKEGVLNPKTGESYREIVLESGGMQEPEILIKKFLGREPSQKPFLESLGIN